MTPEILTAVAALLGSVVAVLVVVAVIVMVARRGFGSLTLKAGPVSVDLQARLVEMADQVKAINDTVNHREPEERTLRERVIAIEEGQVWTREALLVIASHVGCELPVAA